MFFDYFEHHWIESSDSVANWAVADKLSAVNDSTVSEKLDRIDSEDSDIDTCWDRVFNCWKKNSPDCPECSSYCTSADWGIQGDCHKIWTLNWTEIWCYHLLGDTPWIFRTVCYILDSSSSSLLWARLSMLASVFIHVLDGRCFLLSSSAGKPMGCLQAWAFSLNKYASSVIKKIVDQQSIQEMNAKMQNESSKIVLSIRWIDELINILLNTKNSNQMRTIRTRTVN